MFIVIEGQDGSGKDTQAALLKEYLETEKHQKVVHYAESGTGSEDPFIKDIARLTYQTAQDISHRTRVLLYLVNRYEQWQKLAEPALRRGETVIITRNWYSTLVYEGYCAGVSKSLIAKLHKEVMPAPYFHPDGQVILTVSPEQQVERLKLQQRGTEFWKSQGGLFQQKLNSAYLKIAQDYNVPLLDADSSIDAVQSSLRKLLKL